MLPRPDGLPGFLQGQPVVLHHGLPELRLDPRYSFHGPPSCLTLGLAAPVSVP